MTYTVSSGTLNPTQLNSIDFQKHTILKHPFALCVVMAFGLQVKSYVQNHVNVRSQVAL